jgi:hypothetical protein
VRRRVVLGFFDMLYYSRKFKQHMDLKRSARMTAIPQLDVPEILVENEEDRAEREASEAGGTLDTLGSSAAGASASAIMGADGFLSAYDAHHTSHHHRTWSAVSTDLSSYDMSYGHPLAGPRASGPASHSHRNQASAFSFELHESGDGTEESEQVTRGRRGSSVSPAQVREMLDDSVWMESIRRSATTKRNDWGGGGGAF